MYVGVQKYSSYIITSYQKYSIHLILKNLGPDSTVIY